MLQCSTRPMFALTGLHLLHGCFRFCTKKGPPRRTALKTKRYFGLKQFAHGNSRVAHAVRETPLIIIPRQDAAHRSADDFGLVGRES
jgi:hypothetical protein